MVEATQEYYLAQVKALQLELEKVQKELMLGLDSLEAKVRQLESEKAAALLMVSKLEMALQEARELAMVKQYPMGRDWA